MRCIRNRFRPLAGLVALAAGVATAGPSVAADFEVPAHITPYHGTASRPQCRSVSLTPRNVIGLLATQHDEQTVSATVLYRAEGRSERIRLRMMKPDADALGDEIRAMLRMARTRPIRFEATRGRDGECRFTQVAG